MLPEHATSIQRTQQRLTVVLVVAFEQVTVGKVPDAVEADDDARGVRSVNAAAKHRPKLDGKLCDKSVMFFFYENESIFIS